MLDGRQTEPQDCLSDGLDMGHSLRWGKFRRGTNNRAQVRADFEMTVNNLSSKINTCGPCERGPSEACRGMVWVLSASVSSD